jgi:hypothetical protein
MDTNELFNALRLERSPAGRERLITAAIAAGGDIDEIREMLDYLEVHMKETTESSAPQALPPGLSIQPRTS